MSGVPGSGKSTVASALAETTGAVRLDHDRFKTALLDSNVDFNTAGPLSYSVIWMLTDKLLAQKVSVIIDSPCHYDAILRNGVELAKKHEACYRLIECQIDSFDELRKRLRHRPAVRSQRVDFDTPPIDAPFDQQVPGVQQFENWRRMMKRPLHNYFALDTSLSVAECMRIAERFVEECMP